MCEGLLCVNLSMKMNAACKGLCGLFVCMPVKSWSDFFEFLTGSVGQWKKNHGGKERVVFC